LFHTTGDEGCISQTVIDGNHSDRGVTFRNGEVATAMLKGLTITGGHAHRVHPYNSSGGIGCFDSGPTIEYVIVTGNATEGEAEAFTLSVSSPMCCPACARLNCTR
jgi:hypothetical protein